MLIDFPLSFVEITAVLLTLHMYRGEAHWEKEGR